MVLLGLICAAALGSTARASEKRANKSNSYEEANRTILRIVNIQSMFQQKVAPFDRFEMTKLACPSRRAGTIKLLVENLNGSLGRSVARFSKGNLAYLKLTIRARKASHEISVFEGRALVLAQLNYKGPAYFNKLLLGTILEKVCFGNSLMKTRFATLLSAKLTELRNKRARSPPIRHRSNQSS